VKGLARRAAAASLALGLGASGSAAAAPERPAPPPSEKPAPAPPAPAPAGGGDSGADLHQTVATKASRKQLSELFAAPAQKAAKARDWARAIPLHQALVAARGAGGPEGKELATLWTLAGQAEDAAEAWRAYAAAAGDPAERAAALAEAQRLGAAPDPFAARIALAPLAAEAKQALALGRAAFAAKQYGDALVYFHMAYALAPELPGILRELGAAYDALGAAAPKRELYRRFLVQRPFGASSEVARAELAKHSALGTLLVASSLPCTEIWVNRQRLAKVPDKGIAVAPGSYKGLCFNPKLEIALFEYATVEAGKPATMAFRWAIIENLLERPYGRIAIENPKSPGMLIDLGITSKEIGVAAPADGRKLRMVLKDDSGSRTEERMVKIEPGQRIAVRW
jgi:hypothetical protein